MRDSEGFVRMRTLQCVVLFVFLLIGGRLAYAYGLQEEPAPRTPESLIKDFSWDKVPKKDICLPEGLFE